jgi:hypothetical protein
MKRLTSFFTGMIVGAAGLYGAMTFHIVRADDGIHVVPKVTCGLSDVYVDTRKFTVPDWYAHRGLSAAVVNAEKEYLLGDSSLTSLRHSAHGALESLGLK